MLRFERTSNIIDTYIRHTLCPVLTESRIREAFRHYVCKLTAGIDVCEVDDVLFAPVTNDMVLNVHMFSALSSHIVGRVINAGLIVLMK